VENPTTPVQHRRKNSNLLLDSSDVVKVAKFCLDDEKEKAEYEAILNNSAYQIFRDEFVYDRLGHAQIVIWFYTSA
jgi:hypothetical protein